MLRNVKVHPGAMKFRLAYAMEAHSTVRRSGGSHERLLLNNDVSARDMEAHLGAIQVCIGATEQCPDKWETILEALRLTSKQYRQ